VILGREKFLRGKIATALLNHKSNFRFSFSFSPKRNLVLSFLRSSKAKGFVIFAIIAILLVSVFVFLPRGQNEYYTEPLVDDPTASPSPMLQQTPTSTPNKIPYPTMKPREMNDRSMIPMSNLPEIEAPSKPLGVVETYPFANSTVWRKVSENAWRYFEPGVGVDSTTGLPGAGYGWPYFTDWDLGVYIQAVMDAQKIGLIDKDGDWGSIARLDKVLNFLETRKLNETTGYPFWFYQAGDKESFLELSDTAIYSFDTVDAGRLLVALNNLKEYNADWATRINNFVYNVDGNRTNYIHLVPDIEHESTFSSSIYAYYVANGFAGFFSELSSAPDSILDNMDRAGTVTTYDVTLPKADLLNEPLLHAIFELKNNSRILDLAWKMYLAHEARFNATGQYAAFSEGNGVEHGVFIYEWVVLSNGDTWKVTKIDRSEFPINPIIFTKVAFSFLALYNTTYSRDLTIYLEKCLLEPSNGYHDGADYMVDIEGRTVIPQIGSNTNGLILSAARYALQS